MLHPDTPGQVARFANPIDDDEASEIFIVVEMRGDRVLVQYVCDWAIPPQSVYLLADLIVSN